MTSGSASESASTEASAPSSRLAGGHVDRVRRLTLSATLVLALALGLLLGYLLDRADGRASVLLVWAALAALGAAVFLVGFTLRALTRAREVAASVDSTFDALNVGIALYDRDDRLIRCNRSYREQFPEIASKLVPGTPYVELMRAFYPHAPAEIVDGRQAEDFVAEFIGRHRDPVGTETIRRFKDGWLLMTDARSADGGVVSLRFTIDERHGIDIDLRQRRQALDDLAELTFDWFWHTDADNRFVSFSKSLTAFRGIDLIGKRREDIPGFDPDPHDYAAYQEALRQRKPFGWFRYRCTGKDGALAWIAVCGRPVFDRQGGFVGYYGAARDVTDRESMIHALDKSRQQLTALAALATEWYWETDAQLCFKLVRGPGNDAQRFDQVLRGRSLAYVGTHPRNRLDWPALQQRLAARAAFRRQRLISTQPDGRVGYFEISGEPMFERDRFVGYRGLVWDVTERESLLARVTESEARFRALTALSSDWYWEMDGELRISSLQSGGSSAADANPLLGRLLWEAGAQLEPVQPATWEELRTRLEQHQPFRDVLLRRWVGEGTPPRILLISGDPTVDAEGRFIGYRGVGKNITDQVRAQERIERLAKVDPLTQLCNRQSFDELAQRQLAAALEERRQCALLFLDLDNFRLLNNGYGHRVGDRVLTLVSNRMRAVVPEPNLMGRRGGDELVVLLTDVQRPEVAVETAQKLIKSISEPERVLGMEVTVTPSIGIAFFPNDGADLDSLLNAADAAMYQAKDAGRKTYAFYTAAVARRVDLRLRLEQRLRKALESRDFRLFYQPLVSLADGKMVGAEALIRWKDAELGDISPSEFIPIAEESGLIIGLGDWVIREACRSRRVWRGLGLDLPPIAVNFSSVQLRQLGCVEGFLDVLAEYEVQPGDIEVEVTETGLLDISSVARENLIRLRNAGVKIALDDFGVGFSSLSHLRDLPINRLKIDRSFTVECMRDARTLTIVKAVIEMARSLGIAVTAEGIETQAQQTWMQHLGCDSAQGYLFSRPIPADDFLKHFLDKRGVGRERSLMH